MKRPPVRRTGDKQSLMNARRAPAFGMKKFDAMAHLAFQKPMSGRQLEQQAKQNKRNRRISK